MLFLYLLTSYETLSYSIYNYSSHIKIINFIFLFALSCSTLLHVLVPYKSDYQRNTTNCMTVVSLF